MNLKSSPQSGFVAADQTRYTPPVSNSSIRSGNVGTVGNAHKHRVLPKTFRSPPGPGHRSPPARAGPTRQCRAREYHYSHPPDQPPWPNHQTSNQGDCADGQELSVLFDRVEPRLAMTPWFTKERSGVVTVDSVSNPRSCYVRWRRFAHHNIGHSSDHLFCEAGLILYDHRSRHRFRVLRIGYRTVVPDTASRKDPRCA